jgi:hypothetical protein
MGGRGARIEGRGSRGEDRGAGILDLGAWSLELGSWSQEPGARSSSRWGDEDSPVWHRHSCLCPWRAEQKARAQPAFLVWHRHSCLCPWEAELEGGRTACSGDYLVWHRHSCLCPWRAEQKARAQPAPVIPRQGIAVLNITGAQAGMPVPHGVWGPWPGTAVLHGSRGHRQECLCHTGVGDHSPGTGSMARPRSAPFTGPHPPFAGSAATSVRCLRIFPAASTKEQ